MALLSGDERYAREYKNIYDAILENLEVYANYGPDAESGRKYVFSNDGYIASTVNYDDFCQYLKQDMRRGEVSAIGCIELKEILRLNHMINRLDSMLEQEKFWARNSSVESYFMSHPQWLKIERQARKALGLLRKQ